MVAIDIDGRRVAVRPGISVAAALLNEGATRFRSSVRGEPRGPLCGMGSCHECRVTLDGVAQQRACMRTVCEGMRVVTGG
jgi:D-hydroxyproline dehydrogenase subunit gamma